MNLILLGAPGAGKGTVSKLLVEKKGMVQISTGDILRGAIKEGSDLGKKAEGFMTRGELVPDQLILDIIEEKLSKEKFPNGFILDGFPRTIPQAEGLKKIMSRLSIKINAAVDLIVDENEIVKRLSSRRTCSNSDCQAIYNVFSKPTKKEGVCDLCGSPVVQRSDETEDAIKVRLNTYKEKTAPLVDYYKNEGLLKSIDANKGSDKVCESIISTIE
ncbi:MAG TPA: adenylate kinase [Spirochaetota bacterium]|nr:adenylate kinase [Spirochaetota bacterium]HPK56020.1 adenylate kinase [Spirochaetota bacterium]